MNDLAGLRREYAEGGLDESDAAADPMTMFRRWLDDVIVTPMHEPNAMVVSTVSDGQPSSRLVLLKGLDDGFVFYTNYDSRKARELAANPRCSLLFPWHPVGRQVRVEGVASKVAEEESAGYFASRPRDSQLGAWASPQSTVVPDRESLDRRLAEVTERFGGEVPLPDFWGGYRVVPHVVEFWQGRFGRLHDRLRYRRDGEAWVRERLAP
ncbi:MAG TPA: pyridoxamine 5'-phosphate oxidase [Nocardioidaceae bacterium]|nr:pyridoxamine 5'-phosphate oxidase [Nocardioidaceae bacterium]